MFRKKCKRGSIFDSLIQYTRYECSGNDGIDKKTGKLKSNVNKNELFRSMISQCSSQLHIDYVLADSWVSSNKNFKHIVAQGLDFIIAIKSNRLVALSEEDKEKGKWTNIKSLDLEQVSKKVWLKGLDFIIK